MSLEAARRAVEFIDQHITDDVGNPHFGQTGVTTFELVKEGFQSISEKATQRKLAFVDGGNKEIMGAPNFSVQLNRIYSSAWRGKSREPWKLPRVEFFSSTYSFFKDGEIYYRTAVIPSSGNSERYLPDEKYLTFRSLDRSLMNGNQRASIERVGSVARQFAEWRMAHEVLDELSEGDVLVMDGTLQGNVEHEVNYVKDLYEAAKQRCVILTGISKTSTTFTTTGQSLIGAVNRLAQKEHINGNWYFKVAESRSIDHDAMITVAKLNSVADWVFRFEILREQYDDLGREGVEEVFSLLCQNSNDATFPGYPYGLMDADRFARVSFDEVGYYRSLLMSEISKSGKTSKFLSHIHSSDAHDLLNVLVG
jgi:hypothetical protein